MSEDRRSSPLLRQIVDALKGTMEESGVDPTPVLESIRHQHDPFPLPNLRLSLIDQHKVCDLVSLLTVLFSRYDHVKASDSMHGEQVWKVVQELHTKLEAARDELPCTGCAGDDAPLFPEECCG